MIRATEHPVSRVTNRDQIAWAANTQLEPTARGNGRAAAQLQTLGRLESFRPIIPIRPAKE